MLAKHGMASLLLLLTLSACDNTPDKAFQQRIRDRDARKAGDPYRELEGQMPQHQTYDASKPVQFAAQAKEAAASYGAVYAGLLGTLDADKRIARSSALFTRCRAAFAAAVAVQADSAHGTAIASAMRAKASSALRDCRRSAKSQNDDPTAKLLARFASTGMVLVATSIVGDGDRATGIALWSEGEKAVSEDTPGFQFNLKSLQPY